MTATYHHELLDLDPGLPEEDRARGPPTMLAESALPHLVHRGLHEVIDTKMRSTIRAHGVVDRRGILPLLLQPSAMKLRAWMKRMLMTSMANHVVIIRARLLLRLPPSTLDGVHGMPRT